MFWKMSLPQNASYMKDVYIFFIISLANKIVGKLKHHWFFYFLGIAYYSASKYGYVWLVIINPIEVSLFPYFHLSARMIQNK